MIGATMINGLLLKSCLRVMRELRSRYHMSSPDLGLVQFSIRVLVRQ